MPMTSKRKRSVAVQKDAAEAPKSCTRCCAGSCYIAAELRLEQLPMTFILGDNKRYVYLYCNHCL